MVADGAHNTDSDPVMLPTILYWARLSDVAHYSESDLAMCSKHTFASNSANDSH